MFSQILKSLVECVDKHMDWESAAFDGDRPNTMLIYTTLEKAKRFLKENKTTLTFSSLRAANVARCNESYFALNSRSPESWLSRVTEELGEVAQILNRMDSGRMTQEQGKLELCTEIADVQIHLDLLAARLEIDLGEATCERFNVVSYRIKNPRRLGHEGMDRNEVARAEVLYRTGKPWHPQMNPDPNISLAGGTCADDR